MSKWSIHKTLECCYGHRVYTQQLNGEFAADLRSACRHYHGHEGKIEVFLESDTLDHTGMVTDFRHLEWAKKFINEYIDHQFIMDINDPMFETFAMIPYSKLTGKTFANKWELHEKSSTAIVVPDTNHIVGYKLDLEGLTPFQMAQADYEIVDGLTIVDFVPTSENLSKWMADMIQAKMSRIGVKVSRIDWWETPKSCSTYIAE